MKTQKRWKEKSVSSPAFSLSKEKFRRRKLDFCFVAIRTLGFIFYTATTVAVRVARVFDLFLFFNEVIKRSCNIRSIFVLLSVLFDWNLESDRCIVITCSNTKHGRPNAPVISIKNHCKKKIFIIVSNIRHDIYRFSNYECLLFPYYRYIKCFCIVIS